MAGVGVFNELTGLVKNKNPLAGVGNWVGNTALSTSYTILDELGNALGFVNSLTPSKSRPTTRIRHISSADSGRTIEQAPSPEDVTLSITGFTLYRTQGNNSLLQRLASNLGIGIDGAIASLEEQKIPFSIRRKQTNPATKEDLEIVEYQDCWITNHSEPLAISTATISESVTINVSRVVRIK